MKRNLLLTLLLYMFGLTAFAQDEGQAVAKARFERPNSILLGGGISTLFGDNVADYSVGINFELGYLKRINKVMSIGGSLSYISFKYDPSVTEDYAGGSGNNIFFNDTGDQARIVYLEGGDLSLSTASFNLKLNFIPVGDNTKFSVFGFAKPFITYSSRTAVSGIGELWYYDFDQENWLYDSEESWDENSPGLEALAKSNKFTGGIFIGPGIEFMPSNKVSFFAQAAIGYTFPINYVSTAAYPQTFEGYLDPDFPLKSKGFPSLNLQAGMSFHF